MTKAKQIPYVDPEASLFAHAAVAIGVRLDELVEFEHYLNNPDEVYELHQMRIAAKRLRYAMDVFQKAYADYSSLGSEFAAAMSEIKLIQSHLGDIHDADVLVPRLATKLHKLMATGVGKDKKGEPKVGVHLIDFDSCQGLLTLCKQSADARDASFDKLALDWSRMQSEGLFDSLRRLLRSAITEQTLISVLHEKGKDSTSPEVVEPAITDVPVPTNEIIYHPRSKKGPSKKLRTTSDSNRSTDSDV